MKYLVALGALVSTTLAADCLPVALTAIPSCAQSCFLNGAPSIGCGGTDFGCQCEKEAALYAAVEGCVSSGCPAPSYQAVIDGASSVCGCVAGVAVATTTNAVGQTTTATLASATGGVSNTVVPGNTGTTGAAPTPTTTGVPVETYTSRPVLTPTATAGAASTDRAMLGLIGGAAFAVAML